MGFVTIENVNKTFNGETVLHNLNLSFEEGELVTFLGPSGCGKSTLLRIIAGLINPEQGTIQIDGKNVTNVIAKDRQVGMVFQSYALFPNMNVAENIAFGLKMKKLSKTIINSKVAKMIELVGLNGKETAYPRELSGGQQQRVALARSLVTEPKVLLLDEPLSALDAQIRKNLQKQLRSIQQDLKMTMVLVTHDQEEAMAVSDRIFILNKGYIEQSGSPEEIYTKPASEFVARFIGNYNVFTKDQLQLLLGNSHELPHRLYAVRPEAFCSEPGANRYQITGKIEKVMMLGNITRSELVSQGVTILIENLHKTDNQWVAEQQKSIYLQKQDVIPLA